MLLGADTGFFIRMVNGLPRAIELWEQLKRGEHDLIVSTLSANELLTHFIRRGIPAKGEEVLERIHLLPTAEIVPVSLEIAVRSARYRVGLGLPTVDAVILATFLEAGCHLLLTTDQHFQVAGERQIIEVELLS
ncbi:MAG: type II toxin-antitoxin system VapC family toxin [Anaerolineae bacterium]